MLLQKDITCPKMRVTTICEPNGRSEPGIVHCPDCRLRNEKANSPPLVARRVPAKELRWRLRHVADHHGRRLDAFDASNRHAGQHDGDADPRLVHSKKPPSK